MHRIAGERQRRRPASSGGRSIAGLGSVRRKLCRCGRQEHPSLFPAMYVALVRVGEVSGTLDSVLEELGMEPRARRADAPQIDDAMQYPAFVLIAAVCVMLFFILFVLPQFSSVLQDFGAKSDPRSASSSSYRTSFARTRLTVTFGAAWLVASLWWLLRRPGARATIMTAISRVPGIASVFQFYRTSLFCRKSRGPLSSGVNLTATLRHPGRHHGRDRKRYDLDGGGDRVSVTAASFRRTTCVEQHAADGDPHAAAGPRKPGNYRCWQAGRRVL